MQSKKAFTLLEVLISIGLLGIVMSALFSTVSMMRASNAQLLGYLEKAKVTTLATKVLYLDILSSNGALTLKKKENFTQLCIEETTNSLYELTLAKVCWVVLKKETTLVRVEGNNFNLPLKFEDKVEVDTIMKNLESFDVSQQEDKVLVVIKEKKKEAISFLLQGIIKPIPESLKKKNKRKKNKTINKS